MLTEIVFFLVNLTGIDNVMAGVLLVRYKFLVHSRHVIINYDGIIFFCGIILQSLSYVLHNKPD